MNGVAIATASESATDTAMCQRVVRLKSISKRHARLSGNSTHDVWLVVVDFNLGPRQILRLQSASIDNLIRFTSRHKPDQSGSVPFSAEPRHYMV
jgi:hypothetical protein